MNTTKYQTEIQTAFDNLGFTPRPGQIAGISEILTKFVDEDKTNVCLTAPTGSGKSIVGVVAVEALSIILGDRAPLKSVVGMHQNTLVNQYSDTFKNNSRVIQIKGASNYSCTAVNGTAENCISSSLRNMNNGADIRTKHCQRCEFDKLKSQRNATQHLVTNYSYIFVDRMLTEVLDERLCYVWDEAHMLNDVFTEHNAIYVSVRRLKSFVDDVSNYKISERLTPAIFKLQSQLESNKVNESNYLTFITNLSTLYGHAKSFFEEEVDRCIMTNSFGRLKVAVSLFRKYGDMCCKISDLLTYDYKHVFDSNPTEKEFTIKAVFIGDMFKVLRNSKYNLFMSATLSDEFIHVTMNLDPNKTAFVHMSSTFPKENKKVRFVKPLLNLNYQSMQSPTTQASINRAVAEIVKHHDKLKESGVIFVPSFKVCEQVTKELRRLKLDIGIFEHIRGTKAADVVQKFKSSNKHGVLISPSIFEGVDLPDDMSRFQIITKVPWPSLGDKRMKYISTNHPRVYMMITMYKLVQCLGRSVRSPTDYAVSYVLDQHGFNLLTSDDNVWFDEMSYSYVNLEDNE